MVLKQQSFSNFRVLSSIDDWRNDFLTEFPSISTPNIKTGALTLIRQCTPTDRLSGDRKLVLLFKFMTLMGKYTNDISMFIDAIQPYMRKSIRLNNQLENFASILTLVFVYCLLYVFFHFISSFCRLYDHYALMAYFEKTWSSFAEEGWIYFAYMLVLEKSKDHLKKQ